ncbi:FliM/FliN family flagellar motor switch protein [Pseudoduganella umbonata]|uniref:Flagellar motor switch protein FliM n=1 Tax=Pseudoduganella umbonata TaxID=864828 RepID=A0A4P8HQ51_9BURK|nr:FliM/FliN family flagellar motor switch protein [Pseudoduganella umbonata]MBB3221424.1 flagellar motor switch protein FliM [Pseudoduganella umbonata]QCP10580.1 FliM/FliN family flagellar motor switch protein [Pseudoduganella umbonata]
MTMLTTTAPHQVLDPSLLGRPVHRLPQFAAQLRDDLAAALRQPASRRYWSGTEVEHVGFSQLGGSEPRMRWQYFAAGTGVIGFAIDRPILLAALDQRYGAGKGAIPAPDASQVRVTATEERLGVALGQQLAHVVASRIAASVPGGQPLGAPLPPAAATAGGQPEKGTWVVTMNVRAGELAGKVWFALDKHLISDVLRALVPGRESTTGRQAKPVAPLAQRLQVTLAGQLVSKEVTLGALFDLRIGDVIPISLHRADVMLEDSRLYTAAVTEHKGKLCLTSFEDIE